MIQKKYLLVFGTRPEAIKMAPVIRALKADPGNECIVCVTGQHAELLQTVLLLFGIEPKYNLHAMSADQTPMGLMVRLLPALEAICNEEKPDWVLVQGDTTSALAGAMAACHAGVRLAHIEAGIRSGRKLDPFPEELNRKLIDTMSDIYFAPTTIDRDQLLAEGYPADCIHVTGNTGIDSMKFVLETRNGDEVGTGSLKEILKVTKNLILVTVHRRENQREPLRSICDAIRSLAARYVESVHFVFLVHPNPNINGPVREMLAGLANVTLTEPLGYRELILIANACHFAMTDSGGLQEELPCIGKPTLILRNVTDRPAAVEAGVARLVGTDTEAIVAAFVELMEDQEAYAAMARTLTLFGDGHAAPRIARILRSL